MLLGDLIARLDDEYVAAEVLMELDDLALVRGASEAARVGVFDLGSFVSIAVRRYLNQAPPDEWTSLVSAMERSGDPASALLKRALASALDHEGHEDRQRIPEAGRSETAGRTHQSSPGTRYCMEESHGSNIDGRRLTRRWRRIL